MKKSLLTTLLIAAAGLSASPVWAKDVPLPAGLAIQNELVALWTVGVKDMPKSDESIARCTLRYLIFQGPASGYAYMRNETPNKFIGAIPKNYTGAIDGFGVRRTAERLFGRAPSDIEPLKGMMKRGASYYVDFDQMSDQTGNLLNLKARQLLPAYVRYEPMAEKNEDGSFTVRGRMVRVEQKRDGSSVVADQADFTAKVKRVGFEWKFEGLRIRNAPLG